MKWWEMLVVGAGSIGAVWLGVVLAGRAQEAFASPSGRTYGWAMGVAVVLLAGIIAISAVLAWLRRRERASAASPTEVEQAASIEEK